MQRELVRKPVTPGAINLVQAKAIATAVEVNGTFSKRPQPDRLILTRWGYTTCTATSGSGLKIAGTRTTTSRQRTDQRGFREAIQTIVSFAAAPGGTRASMFARLPASSVM